MRSLHALALVTILALVVLAILTIPSCIEHFVTTPADWKRQREETRKEARETAARLEHLYGGKPVEEWPEERRRQMWRNAKRILGESAESP